MQVIGAQTKNQLMASGSRIPVFLDSGTRSHLPPDLIRHFLVGFKSRCFDTMDLVLDKATAIPWYHSNVTRFTLSAGKVNLESILITMRI